MTNEKSIERDQHPLLGRTIVPIKSWESWMAHWNTACSFDDFMGLLHCGYMVAKREDNLEPAILFYMKVADGWQYGGLFKHQVGQYAYDVNEEGRLIEKTKDQLYQHLAAKAYATLCLRFFKNVHITRGQVGLSGMVNYFEHNFFTTSLFDEIQHLYRHDSDFSYSLRMKNIEPLKKFDPNKDTTSNGHGYAISFIALLAHSMWQWKGEEIEEYMKADRKEELRQYNDAIQTKIQAAKPWMIRLLSYLEMLDELESSILTWDDVTLNALRELALDTNLNKFKIPIQKDRKAKTVEEAALVGSRAALMLMHHEVVSKEYSRLMQIDIAERTIAESQKKLNELNL